MSDAVNLTELRAYLEVDGPAWAWQVLALIDAVEAAHELLNVPPHFGNMPIVNPAGLRSALARFDFGVSGG